MAGGTFGLHKDTHTKHMYIREQASSHDLFNGLWGGRLGMGVWFWRVRREGRVDGRRWRVRELGRVWVVGDGDGDGLCGAVRNVYTTGEK
jgi:hypothetical protein